MRTLLAALMVASGVLGMPQRALGQQTGATVEVQNNLEDRIEVFVEYGQFDRRVGTAAPRSVTELSLPAGIVAGPMQPIQLFVVHEGRDLATRSFEVSPGENIGLLVPSEEPATEEVLAPLPAEDVSETTLTVENQRSTDVTVFVEEDLGLQVRLGTVSPNSRRTLEFPSSVVGSNQEITVLVEPRGQFELETHPLHLAEGEHLLLRLTPK